MIVEDLWRVGMVMLALSTEVESFNAGSQIRPFPQLCPSSSTTSATTTTVGRGLTGRRATSSPLDGQQSAKLDMDGLRDIAKGVFAEDKRPVILYDGVCNMCNGFVNLLLDIDTTEMFRFSALQSGTGRALLALSGRSPDDISSIVLVEDGGDCLVQSDAVLRMGRLLGGPVGLLLLPGVILPKFVRDKMYDAVADNRYSFLGKRDECRCSDDGFADRFV